MKWAVTVINKYNVDITKLTGVSGIVIGIMFTHSSPLGNPYYKEKDRSRSLALFTEYFNKEIVIPDSAVKLEADRIFDILTRTKRLYLVCCCKPLPCHGDIIKKSLDDAMTKWVNKRIFKKGGNNHGY